MLADLIRILWVAIDFLQAYNGAVTAIATVAIGVFTYFLVRVSGRQARLTRNAIELSNKEFISTHRPKLRVRLFRGSDFDTNMPLRLQYEIINIGQTEAHVVEHTLSVETFAPQWGARNDATSIRIEKPIVAGGTRLVSWTAQQIVYDGNWGDSFSIDFIGKIVYRDSNGAIRRTGFYRRFKSAASRFEIVPDPDYEYED